MRAFLFFSFLVIFFNSALGQKIPKDIQHLRVRRLNDSYIDVFIYNNIKGKKVPLLIFCQGSGFDSNTEGFLELGKQFKNQVASMTLEKQGVNYGDNGDSLSVIYKVNNTIYNRLYDYLRVLEYLKVNVNWWSGEIYVIGGSEGGLMAGLLASFYPKVKGLAILCYGGGLKFGEVWPIASGLQKKVEGGTIEEVKKEEALVKDSLKYIQQNPTFLKSYSGEDNTYAWWASIADLRLSNSLIDLNIPIFIGQGTDDLMAPAISAQKVYEDFLHAGKKNLYYKEYKGYDHAFTDKSNQSHLIDVFMEAIKWILQKATN